MKRYSGWANDTIEVDGKRLHVSGGVFSREFRNRRIPRPAPKPLDPAQQQLVRKAAEGRLATWEPRNIPRF
jgi:hypothetical protein